MEESTAISWPQVLRGFGGDKFGDRAYLSCGLESDSSNLHTSALSYTEFTTSDSLTGTTAHCDYFDSLQTDMWMKLTTDPTADAISNSNKGSISPILEQPLTCKDVVESPSSWVFEQLEMFPHQPSIWTQQNLNCGATDPECKSSMQLTENQLGHIPKWMMEMSAGSFNPITQDIISSANHMLQSRLIASFREDQQLQRPSCTASNKIVAASEKAAARKYRRFCESSSFDDRRCTRSLEEL